MADLATQAYGTQEASTLETQAPTEATPNPEEKPKKKRGKPKDPNAPKRPQTAFGRFTAEERERLKEADSPILKDLAGLGKHMKEGWEKCPQEKKDAWDKLYQAEMEIWRPQWEAYKATDGFKEFNKEKLDWIDGRQMKLFLKSMSKAKCGKCEKTVQKLLEEVLKDKTCCSDGCSKAAQFGCKKAECEFHVCEEHARAGPKRPKSGYMLFAAEVRDRVKAQVFKDKEANPEINPLKEVGTRIADEWKALTEAQKAQYGEQAVKEKEKYDEEFAVYSQTEKYKKLLVQKAQLTKKQKLGKLVRTSLDDAPKKPPSAINLFAKEIAHTLKPAEGEKMKLGDKMRLISSKFKELPDSEKERFSQEVARLKKEYDLKLKEFKRHKKYIEYLSAKKNVKQRENKDVNLLEQPKKPKSVFALFAAEHKNEVPKGKGEGKGVHALKQKWSEAPEELKKKYEESSKALKEQYMEEVSKFKETESFKGFKKNENSIKREFTNEAMKVITLKFLSDAPASPPGSALAVFLGEKRKALADENGGAPKKLKKEEKKQEFDSLVQEFKQLDQASKDAYEALKREKVKEWEVECKAFMAQERWKEYIAEAKALKLPVKNLLRRKKQAIKKLANGARLVPIPERPESYPKKPPGAYALFVKDKRGEVEVGKLGELWSGLDPEQKDAYEKQAAELREEYQKAMEDFANSEEGKTYTRKVKQVGRQRRMSMAKAKFLKDLPKKPLGALQLFMKNNAKEVKRKEPNLKGFEIQKLLQERWKALDESEKQRFKDEADEAKKAFDEKMAEYKETENFKSYTKVVKSVLKRPVKKGSTGPPPRKPENMPVKPEIAFKAFHKSQVESGTASAAVQAAWRDLTVDERAKWEEEASERLKQYEQDMVEFNKSKEGKRYRQQVASYQKRKATNLAKSKFLKDQPKSPPSALTIFMQETREQVMRENPDLKGSRKVDAKLGELWKSLSEEEKDTWTAKEKEKAEEYETAMEEFRNSANYKKYLAATSRTRPKAKAKGKARPMEPQRPENFPKKPPNAMILFQVKQREAGKGGKISEMAKAWAELGDGKQPYLDEAKELQEKYEADLKEFNKSAEGKKYNRLKAQAEKKSRLRKVKDRLLGQGDVPKEPKKPPSAYWLFAQEKRGSMTGKLGDVAKELAALWSGMSPEDKKEWDDKAADLRAKYLEEKAVYDNSEAVKKYNKAVRSISGRPQAKKPKAKAKGKGKAAAGGRGRGKAQKTADKSDSDSAVMGSDSSSSDSGSDSGSD